jgi:hypothetical protein
MWSLALVTLAIVVGCSDSNNPPAPRLFAADGAGGTLSSLYELNPATGAVKSTIGPIGFAVTGMAVDPQTGTLYGVTGANDPASPSFLITINPTTGAGTIVGDELPSTKYGAADITFTSDGTLYGWSEDSDELVTINKTTGAATVVGPNTIGTYGSGLAASSSNILFLTGDGDQGDLTTVNRTTGAATTVGTLNGANDEAINALAFNGSTLYGSSVVICCNTSTTTELITINTSTGAITVIGPSLAKMDALVWK